MYGFVKNNDDTVLSFVQSYRVLVLTATFCHHHFT